VLVGNIEMDIYFVEQLERIRKTCCGKALVEPLTEGLAPKIFTIFN